MRQSVRRAMIGLGALTTAGAWVLGLSGAATASPVAVAGPAAHAAPARLAATVAAAYKPARHSLYPGQHSAAVRRMQRRLAQLKYYPGPVNGMFDADTLEAVWAFKEVQGIQTSRHPNVVGRVMQHDLVRPRLPKVLVHHHNRYRRIEVNQRIQVLVLYHRSKVELISHVSPGAGCLPGQGCGWITPDGNYRAQWFARGWIHVPLGEMYNPVFFIGSTFAIHGDIPVPLQPASHGCVRIPMDIAGFFHKLIRISYSHGTPIFIRGRAPGT